MFSPAFIALDYIFDHELPAINNKCARGDMVLPVVIDRCLWKTFVGVLQAAPVDSTGRLVPLLDWKPRRHGFNAACEQIRDSIETQFGGAPETADSMGQP